MSEEAVNSLVDRAREGDADAFGLLYDRFQPEILSYLTHQIRNPETAEDLTQQVFLKVWQAIPRYEQRGTPFKAWLYRMAPNQVIDQYRKQRPTTDLESIDPAVDAEAEEAVLAQERHERLRAAMDRLSPDHREVLVQRFLMEKSAAEIGEAMDRKEVNRAQAADARTAKGAGSDRGHAVSNPRFEEALDRCIADIVAGRRSVADCLAEWPQFPRRAGAAA